MVAQTRRCPLSRSFSYQEFPDTIQHRAPQKFFCEYCESSAEVIFLAKNGRFEKKEVRTTLMCLFVEMTRGSGVARKLAVLGQKSREQSCFGSVANI